MFICLNTNDYQGGETNNKKNNNKSSCRRHQYPEKISEKGTQADQQSDYPHDGLL